MTHVEITKQLADLAKEYDAHFDVLIDDEDDGCQFAIDKHLANHIFTIISTLRQKVLDLESELSELRRENYVVIDDDSYIEVVSDLDAPRYDPIDPTPATTKEKYKNFVGKWREKEDNESNVIPFEIHPYSPQARKERYEKSFRLFMEGREFNKGA
jgi:hypothetical protein